MASGTVPSLVANGGGDDIAAGRPLAGVALAARDVIGVEPNRQLLRSCVELDGPVPIVENGCRSRR
jgi:hypothetical protein